MYCVVKEISHISRVSSYRTFRKLIFSILVLILINLQEVVHFNAGEKDRSGSKTDLDSKGIHMITFELYYIMNSLKASEAE